MKDLKKVITGLKKASKMHLAQAKVIKKHLQDMKKMSKKKK
tara:strand:- start:2885 stop:3007 length:123 start_codon:yes stop_codon:yes gene_type:complete